MSEGDPVGPALICRAVEERVTAFPRRLLGRAALSLQPSPGEPRSLEGKSIGCRQGLDEKKVPPRLGPAEAVVKVRDYYTEGGFIPKGGKGVEDHDGTRPA